MLFTKQVGDHLRLLLTPIQMAAHGGHEFGSVGRPALAEPVRLDVLVQQLIGIQFRAVARHPNEPQPRGVSGGNARGFPGFVHGMPVHNQRDPAVDLLEQPLQNSAKTGALNLPCKLLRRLALKCRLRITSQETTENRPVGVEPTARWLRVNGRG